jgi:hypothetical protein
MFWVWDNGQVVGKTALHPDNLGNFQSASDMIDALIDFYLENGYGDLAKATRGWCSVNGIPFTH